MHQTQYQSRQKLLRDINIVPTTIHLRGTPMASRMYTAYSDGEVFVVKPSGQHTLESDFQVYVGGIEVEFSAIDEGTALRLNMLRYKKPGLSEETHRDKSSTITAPSILGSAKEALDQRAALRDSEGTGERSIAKTVDIFNAWTGRDLTEQEGWKFMVALKQARESQGKFHEDDYVDGASYFALLGESCAKETQTKTT